LGLVEENYERPSVYLLQKPDNESEDPLYYLVKGMKELLDYEYINKVNNDDNKNAFA
jgi:hypothetical protein